MGDNLYSTEQRSNAIKFMLKEGEIIRHAYARLRIECLCRNHSASVDDVKCIAQACFNQTPAAFFEKKIMNLMPRWQRCIASDEDYVNK